MISEMESGSKQNVGLGEKHSQEQGFSREALLFETVYFCVVEGSLGQCGMSSRL